MSQLSSAPANPRKRSRPTDPSFGPLSDAHPSLRNLSKSAAITQLKEEIRKHFYPSGRVKAPKCQPAHQAGHQETKPRLCLGGGEIHDNAGRWFQVCLQCKDTGTKSYIHFITDPVDVSALRPLFDIWDEINAYQPNSAQLPASSQGSSQTSVTARPVKRRRIRDATDVPARVATAARLHSPVPAATAARPHPPVPAATSAPVAAEESITPEQVEQGNIFNLSLPMTVIGYTSGAITFEETLYPRHDSYIRLSDYKLLLGQKGFEQGSCLEYYNFGTGEWTPCSWTAAHFVAGNDYVLQIRIRV